jgi:hypothetical protein
VSKNSNTRPHCKVQAENQPPTWRELLEFHPLAAVDPLLEGGEYAALVENIRNHGLYEPITLYEGKILDGRNRWRACTEAGIEPKFSNRRFNNDTEAKAFLDSANWHRRHLTSEQKLARITTYIKANPTQSDRQIAEKIGASHPHVAKVRRKLEKSGEVETVTTSVDKHGHSQPRQRSKPATAKPAMTADIVDPIGADPTKNGSTSTNPIALVDGNPIDGNPIGTDAIAAAAIAADPIGTDQTDADHVSADAITADPIDTVPVRRADDGDLTGTSPIARALTTLLSFGRFKLEDFQGDKLPDPIDLFDLISDLQTLAGEIKRAKKQAAAAPLPDDLPIPEFLRRSVS